MRLFVVALCATFLIPACTTSEETPVDDKEMVRIVSTISYEDWGEVDGRPVKRWVLDNGQGMICKVAEYGATVTDLIMPDKDGRPGDVAARAPLPTKNEHATCRWPVAVAVQQLSGLARRAPPHHTHTTVPVSAGHPFV